MIGSSPLGHRPDEDAHDNMAGYLRSLCCDLLANAERRLRDSQFEDTLLRAYRILELIGQVRLFAHGYDSSHLPSEDETIAAFQKKLKQNKSTELGRSRKPGGLTAGRMQTARLLKCLKDPMAQELLDFDKRHAVQTASRNASVLVHGFEAQAPSASGLKDTLARLEDLLQKDDPTAAAWLCQARRLNFSSG